MRRAYRRLWKESRDDLRLSCRMIPGRLFSDRAPAAIMIQHNCRHRRESQQQDLDSQYRYPMRVEQAQEGVFLAKRIGSHHAAIGLQHEHAVSASGERESDAEDAAGDVERIDGFAGFGQGSLMKVEGGGMMVFGAVIKRETSRRLAF